MGLLDTPPGRRIPFDVDGSVLIAFPDGEASATASAAEMAQINSELNNEWSCFPDLEQWGWISIVFPDKQDLDGIFASSSTYHSGDRFGAVEVSENTTNGEDGTWVQVVATLPDLHSVNEYRNTITPLSVIGVLGVRVRWFRYIGRFGNLHVYGNPSASATLDRIDFLDPSTGQPFEELKDTEEVPQGQTQVFQMIVKNMSGTLTANDVDLTVASLTGISSGWYTFSTDGITYYSSLALGNMTPGQQETIYVEQAVPVGADLGPEVARIKAEPTSWS